MRKFVVLSILAAMMSFVVASCDYFQKGKDHEESAETTYVQDPVEAYVNPSFTSVSELCIFRDLEIEDYRIDDVFCDLPQNTLVNVATVCINRDGFVTKRSCVQEYLKNQSTYDNLSTSTESTKEDTIQIKMPPNVETTASNEDRYIRSERDTIIDGKQARITEYKKE